MITPGLFSHFPMRAQIYLPNQKDSEILALLGGYLFLLRKNAAHNNSYLENLKFNKKSIFKTTLNP